MSYWAQVTAPSTVTVGMTAMTSTTPTATKINFYCVRTIGN
jgi:hypothetical protein